MPYRLATPLAPRFPIKEIQPEPPEKLLLQFRQEQQRRQRQPYPDPQPGWNNPAPETNYGPAY